MISSFSATKAARNPQCHGLTFPHFFPQLRCLTPQEYSPGTAHTPLCYACVAGIYPRDEPPPYSIFTDLAGSFYIVSWSRLTWPALLHGLLRQKGTRYRKCFLPSKEKSSSQTCSLASFKIKYHMLNLSSWDLLPSLSPTIRAHSTEFYTSVINRWSAFVNLQHLSLITKS